MYDIVLTIVFIVFIYYIHILHNIVFIYYDLVKIRDISSADLPYSLKTVYLTLFLFNRLIFVHPH